MFLQVFLSIVLVFSPGFCFSSKKHQVTWATCNTGPLWSMFSCCTNGHKRELLYHSHAVWLLFIYFNLTRTQSNLFWFSLHRDTADRVHSSCQWQHCETQLCPSFSRSALCGRFQSPQLILCVSSASGAVEINTVEVSVGNSFCTQANKAMSYRWNFVPETLLLPTGEKNHQWDLCNMSLVSHWQQSD